jgi:hypothetical protein
MTATEAPAEISGTIASCAAPAKTNTDMASASRAESPPPAAIVPKAKAKGTRASNTGAVAFTPATNAALEDAALGYSKIASSESRAMLPVRISRSRLPK